MGVFHKRPRIFALPEPKQNELKFSLFKQFITRRKSLDRCAFVELSLLMLSSLGHPILQERIWLQKLWVLHHVLNNHHHSSAYRKRLFLVILLTLPSRRMHSRCATVSSTAARLCNGGRFSQLAPAVFQVSCEEIS